MYVAIGIFLPPTSHHLKVLKKKTFIMFNKLSFHQLFCFFAWSTSDYNICAIYTSTIEINISKLRKPFVRLSICFQKLWSLSESWELVGMEKNWSELGTYSRACKICYSFESRLELWSLVVLKVAPNFKAGRNSEAEFKTINVGRGYVMNDGRGYVMNDGRGYVITRVGIELLGQLKKFSVVS